jgi:acetylornithine deacetylase/succinyl-diaminopimelate desuccinylase-like protein
MQNYISLLKQLISFKSISTDEIYKIDIANCAEWLINLFNENNFETKLITGYSNPVVFSSLVVNPAFKTVLIYGHYDVQPADIEEGWTGDPFSVVEKDEKLIARGIVDNKGQLLIHIASVLELKKHGKLKYNIKFILEGDEESGSEKLPQLIKDYADLLKTDFVFFSDGELTMGHPTIDVGFRGIFNCTLTLKTSEKDNHSGLYGGSIPNAALELSKILSSMYDTNGVLNIEDVDNNPDMIDTIIVENNNKLPFDYSEFLMHTGAKRRHAEEKLDFYTQTGFLTSAEITTFKSGYLGEGYKNAIPGFAEAKVNFRISPSLSTKNVIEAFKKFIQSKKCDYFDLDLKIDQACEPISLPTNNEYVQLAKSLATEVYEKESLYRYCGAIVPVAGIFKNVLAVPVISIGLGNEDCNMHGVNENFDVALVQKGLKFSQKFLGNE